MSYEDNYVIKSRRKSTATQEKIRSILDYDASDDIIEAPKPVKKEKVLGRGRGRPPIKRDSDYYVFNTQLANAFTELALETAPSTIIDCHKKFIASNPVLNNDVIRITLSNVARYRNWMGSQRHQAPPPPAYRSVSPSSPDSSMINQKWPVYNQQPTPLQSSRFPRVHPALSIQSEMRPASYYPYASDPGQAPITQRYRPEMPLNMNISRYQAQPSYPSLSKPPPLKAINQDEHAYMMSQLQKDPMRKI